MSETPAEKRFTRKAMVAAGAAGLAGTGIALGIALSAEEEAAKPGTAMRAVFRRGEIPAEDPLSEVWRSARPLRVPLSPQQMAPPFLEEAGVDTLVVRALHNGTELAFRLEWDDPDLDDLDGVARFHDACAVQLPAKAGAPAAITMGAPGSPVHILQWRATWQRDLADGRTGLQELYPRAVRDLTPEELLGDEGAVPYYPGRAVGNPLSAARRASAVEEIVAEGFGSATSFTHQRARGRGEHAGGRWRVAIALPMDRTGAGEALTPGSTWPVAFAVWLGSKGNRGGRKHWANWVSCEIEAA